MTQQITVKCIRDAGDKEADPITDALITTEAAAVARGKRFLDDPAQGGYYQTRRYSMTVPHRGPSIIPGSWVAIDAPAAGINNVAMKIIDYTLSITDRSVAAKITVERYING